MSNDDTDRTGHVNSDSRESLPGEFDIYVGAESAGDAPVAPGTSSGASRYSLHETIGEGGMGVIVKVFDRSLQRTLAMKLTRSAPESADSSASRGSKPLRSRFLKEARITGQLEHPGIVPVHELGTCGGDRAYFTMPLVRGESLGDVFAHADGETGGWNRPRAVGVLIRVCQAVAFAHSRGVVHRDLKPANVMVGRFGEVYVLDWGLAKVRDRDERRDALADPGDTPATPGLDSTAHMDEMDRIVSGPSPETMDGTVMGTPAYMSPEQAAGRIEAIDESSDVYSLGAMLYELLAGQPPYTPSAAHVSPRMVLARVLEEPPRPIATIRPSAPPELVAICDKAMSRDKRARYKGSFELAEDLQAYLDNRVVSAYQTGPVAELKSWMVRHRTLLRSVAAAALVLVLAFAGFVWITRNQEAKRLLDAGDARLASYYGLKAEIPSLEAAWKDAAPRQQWWPVWKRQGELDAHREVEQGRRELAASFNDAVRDFEDAGNIAPPLSVRDAAHVRLRDVYAERRQQILWGAGVTEQVEFYARKLRELGMTADVRETIRLRSQPSGADVYCFRYEEKEAHLLPLPYHAEGGKVIGSPFLRVERIWDASRHQGVFQPGDRLLAVRGQPVQLRGDLARSLDGVDADATVSVTVERLGSRTELEWIPFPRDVYELEVPPPYEPGSLLDIVGQLGLSFEGYPLDFRDECHVGTTRDDRPLEVVLPRGRYLFVLRRIGSPDVRYPVLVPSPGEREVVSIRLPGTDEVPAGFVYVPAGPVAYGGDPVAFQSLEGGETDVEGFLIGRHEVTLGEYLEFLNDPDVVTDDLGFYEPKTVGVRELLRQTREWRIHLVPSWPWRETLKTDREAVKKERLYLTKDGGAWAIRPEMAHLLKVTSPVLGVPQIAGIEYAHWRTEKEGRRRRYRLPTDLEWEKAARGVDRRVYVWGEYLVRSFCWSKGGTYWPRIPPETERCPLDESVYGVRDLAGSVEEYTWSDGASQSTRRGGSWTDLDDTYFRAATRNFRIPYGRGTDAGLRLVIELDPEDSTAP